MTTDIKQKALEEFEKYAAANLNDGEYPIPEGGRMVELQYAIEVMSEFLDTLISSVREETLKEMREAIRDIPRVEFTHHDGTQSKAILEHSIKILL